MVSVIPTLKLRNPKSFLQDSKMSEEPPPKKQKTQPVSDASIITLLSSLTPTQLSLASHHINLLQRIDPVSTLPAPLVLRILGFLDHKSLCRAAQSSKSWNSLASCDEIWHRMCLQRTLHISYLLRYRQDMSYLWMDASTSRAESDARALEADIP